MKRSRRSPPLMRMTIPRPMGAPPAGTNTDKEFTDTRAFWLALSSNTETLPIPSPHRAKRPRLSPSSSCHKQHPISAAAAAANASASVAASFAGTSTDPSTREQRMHDKKIAGLAFTRMTRENEKIHRVKRARTFVGSSTPPSVPSSRTEPPALGRPRVGASQSSDEMGKPKGLMDLYENAAFMSPKHAFARVEKPTATPLASPKYSPRRGTAGHEMNTTVTAGSPPPYPLLTPTMSDGHHLEHLRNAISLVSNPDAFVAPEENRGMDEPGTRDLSDMDFDGFVFVPARARRAPSSAKSRKKPDQSLEPARSSKTKYRGKHTQ